MKTLEEKAKAYDKALEKARKIHNQTEFDYEKGMMEEVFPELAENEDEKIRKQIKAFIKSRGSQITQSKTDAWLAWLEKQDDKDKLIKELGEYKVKYTQEVLEKHLNNMSNKNDERLRKTTIAFLKDFAEQGYENAVECIDWLEKQDEQKPINEDAEKEKTEYVSGQFLYCKGSFNEFKEGESYWLEYIGNDTYVGRSDNILNQKFHITPRQLYTWLDPRHPEDSNKCEQKPNPCDGCVNRKGCINCENGELRETEQNPADEVGNYDHKEVLQTIINEQKSAWSKEDEERLSDAIFFVREYQIPIWDKKQLNAAKETEDWLKSLKQRVQPQPKQEWSEEDEKKISELISFLLVNYPDRWREYADWLKSLKDRVLPQPKPEWSKEDKELLKNITEIFQNPKLIEANQHIAANIIDWLKALKQRMGG